MRDMFSKKLSEYVHISKAITNLPIKLIFGRNICSDMDGQTIYRGEGKKGVNLGSMKNKKFGRLLNFNL